MSTSHINLEGWSKKAEKVMERAVETSKGMVWRIVFTIIVVAAFLVGSLIYVAFYTTGYTLFQRIVVVLIAFIVALAAISIVWVTWAGRRGFIRGWWQS